MTREREYDARELLRARQEERFELGVVVATPGVIQVVPIEDMQRCLARHVAGDWGEVEEEDRTANARALQRGSRLFSAYTSVSGERFWIITEWDRSVTTLLLPQEY